MDIKNYTSTVAPGITINRIQNLLIEAKVNGITMEYGVNQEIVAILFHVNLDRSYSIRLTANVDKVQETFWLDYVGKDHVQKAHGGNDEYVSCNGRKQKKKSDFRAQAEKTAWKLQQDWVEVQLSLLVLQKVDFLQVFMAYLWDGKQTMYSRLKEDGAFLAIQDSKQGPA